MKSYKKLRLARFPKSSEETSENRHWFKYKPFVHKQEFAINHVAFSPTTPYRAAVCTSTRVLLYDAAGNVKRQLTRFKSTVCCANFRGDGLLLAAGTDKGILSVHDMTPSSRIILRTFRDHVGAVRQARFNFEDFTKLCSCSDDKTVRYFDSPSGRQLNIIGEHEDYVRALCQHPTDSSTWISGSYDHTVKFWDTRSDNKTSTRSLDHGAPVEAVLAMPKGTLVLTAGENNIKVWDVMSGRLVTSFSNHQKVVTSLTSSANGTRILSGSADGMVKVYDSTSFTVTHSFTYSAPVLALDISADNSSVCVGLSDGTVSVRTRPKTKAPSAPVASRQIRTGTRRFFERGHREKASAEDYKTEVFKKQQLKPYDKYLKKFQYHLALDAALKTERAVVVASVCDELRIRGGLTIALSGRDEESLQVFLTFLLKNLLNPHYTELLVDVAHLTLDLYTSVIGQSVEIDEQLVQLRSRLRDETSLQKDMFSLIGALDAVVSSATRLCVPLSSAPKQLTHSSTTISAATATATDAKTTTQSTQKDSTTSTAEKSGTIDATSTSNSVSTKGKSKKGSKKGRKSKRKKPASS